VDDRCTGRFFDVEICHSDRLSETTLGSVPFAHVVVTSVRHAETILARLDERAVLRCRVSCL
jgi:hypothetical protein